MGITKEWILLILLELCVLNISAGRTDARSPKQSYSQRIPTTEDDNTQRRESSFSPGNAQLGGWRTHESISFGGNPSQNNQWLSSGPEHYDTSQAQSQFSDILEGQGTSYNPGPSISNPSQYITYSGAGKQLTSGQYSGIVPASSSNGGDLVVGQGSVQRPANFPNYFSSGNFNQAVGGTSSGSKAGLSSQAGPSGPQYTHIVASNVKKPSKPSVDYTQYFNQRPNASYRPVSGKPSPTSSQLLNQSPQTFSGFSGGASHTVAKPQYVSQTQNSNQYPQYVGSRPSGSVSSKPSYRPGSADGFYQKPSTGSRHPASGAGARPNGVKYSGVKFPQSSQPGKISYSSGQGGGIFSG